MRFAIFLLAPMLAFAGETRTLFDPEFNFASSKTFSFVGGKELEKTGILQNPQTRERIKNLIAGNLEPRGLREVPRDEKYDLAVRYWVGGKIETQTHYEPDPYWTMWGGYDPFWSTYWYMPYYELTEQYRVGILVIDLLNPQTKQLVWRTFLSERLDEGPKTYKNIEKHLGKAFSDLPPTDGEKKKMAREVAKRKAEYSQRPKTP